jgi:hypothetical protein
MQNISKKLEIFMSNSTTANELATATKPALTALSKG